MIVELRNAEEIRKFEADGLIEKRVYVLYVTDKNEIIIRPTHHNSGNANE